jgi:hypothetical protein
MSEINLNEYEEVDTTEDFEFEVGDVIYHPKSKRVELIITETTDLIQTEAYPLVENFGCLLLRKKLHCCFCGRLLDPDDCDLTDQGNPCCVGDCPEPDPWDFEKGDFTDEYKKKMGLPWDFETRDFTEEFKKKMGQE